MCISVWFRECSLQRTFSSLQLSSVQSSETSLQRLFNSYPSNTSNVHFISLQYIECSVLLRAAFVPYGFMVWIQGTDDGGIFRSCDRKPSTHYLKKENCREDHIICLYILQRSGYRVNVVGTMVKKGKNVRKPEKAAFMQGSPYTSDLTNSMSSIVYRNPWSLGVLYCSDDKPD